MFLVPRLNVRKSVFILMTVVFVLSMRDSVFEFLSILFPLEKAEFRLDDDILIVPPIPPKEVKRELVLLQMIYRHGHRTPFMLYPNDPNSELDFKEGLGMLTKLGRLQHYVMGKHLRERYRNFITSNPKEVDMTNSNSFRCQYGAYSFLAGLYAPSKEFSFTDEIEWQPLISRPAHWREKLVLNRGACKVADEEADDLLWSKEAEAVFEKYKDLYNFWSIHSGRLIDNWRLAADLGKTIESERDMNLTVPEWSLRFWDEFEFQVAIHYYFNFKTRLIQRYRIGPLFGFMAEQMNAKILGRIPDKRVFIYSGHGSNMVNILLALDQYDWQGAPYASTVVLELWKESDDYTIRWLYFNSSNPERQIDPPVVFRIQECGGGDFCSLSTFLDFIRRLVPEDWEAECNDMQQKKRFQPFESPISIPGLSAAERISFSYIAMSILLCYVCCHRTLRL